MNDRCAVLRRQQLAFQAGVLGQDVGALLQRAPDGGEAPLGVYRHAHQARLAGALRDNFEILALALGDEAFAALAAAYVAAQPSAQPSIRWFGHRLSVFMAECGAADETAGGLVPHPALTDLARMDWALRGAFDAADAPLTTRDALAALPPDDWPGLHLALHPSVDLVALQWAVEGAWQALRTTRDAAVDDPDAAPVEPALAAPEAHVHSLLVWRRGLDTCWRSLAPAEATLLHAVAAGASFGALCEQAAALVAQADQAAPLVVAALQQWLADGLISAWRVEARPCQSTSAPG